MPINGSGNYVLPSGTTVTTGTTVASVPYNEFLSDLEAVLNLPQTIARGGTGASTVSGAQTALQLVPGTHTLAYNARVQSLADVAGAADKLPYLSGANAFSLADLSAYVRGILGSANESAFKEAINAEGGVDFETYTALQAEAAWEAGTSTGESKVSPAKVKSSILALGGSGVPNAVLQDQKDANTDGGGANGGSWATRDINTEFYDPGGLVSISSNTFTFTVAGWVKWSAPSTAANSHRTRLYNVTDAEPTAYGTSERIASALSTSRSFGSAPVVAGKTYRLEHQLQNTNLSTGFGGASNMGAPELYTIVEFWRMPA